MAIVIKTPEQIEGIRKSCKLSSDTLRHISPFVVPGVTTNELDAKCEEFIRSNGGIPAPLGYKISDRIPVYPKATCTSINEVICHGIPSDRQLVEGDIIGIDVSTILDGYFGDTCYTFAVGEISEENKKILTVSKECLDRGVSCCGPKRHIGNIGFAIAKHAHNNNFSVVAQFCGHGVGLELHEPPNVPHIGERGKGPIMKPGMIFTIEPMLCIGTPEVFIEGDYWTARTKDKKISAQYEHTVLITETGYEVLTSFDGVGTII